ncbi:hypothetical protein [Thalassoglobus polymorphus]|uniref:Uncharacterized protein n=1 Tax=Thalassoglobus polymorphus TaxID=2527994 RepID=A0A517QH83_9PLAN|nr:hypothetical protein [Thalassoglobus polymorphus]QDT30994.1 hypothetical protein Mal48_02240 [Thalassoglobus polymorphus]
MTLSTTTIDRIVANVLSQLSTPDEPVHEVSPSPEEARQPPQHQLSNNVITAEQLESIPAGQTVFVPTKAIITPAAVDVVRERKLTIERTSHSPESQQSKATNQAATSNHLSIAIVRHTENVQQAIAELGDVNKELVSCPDDAAKFAISELCRTGAGTVLIFAEQTHRAACLTNRNSKAKAVVANDSGEVKKIRKQLRANVWCIDPTNRSYFELKNLLKVICSK